jgi:hypothetical protein
MELPPRVYYRLSMRARYRATGRHAGAGDALVVGPVELLESITPAHDHLANQVLGTVQ